MCVCGGGGGGGGAFGVDACDIIMHVCVKTLVHSETQQVSSLHYTLYIVGDEVSMF